MVEAARVPAWSPDPVTRGESLLPEDGVAACSGLRIRVAGSSSREGVQAVGWTTDEFGASHEGYAGAVLDDGSEPKPVYLDIGSGSGGCSTSEWWAYNGQMRRPRAAGYRAACECGWRGDTYPIDWDQVMDDRLDGLDTSGPFDDWREHIRKVECKAVPVPADVTAVMDQLEAHLAALVEEAPVAALRAVARLERVASSAGREAACGIEYEALSAESVAAGLGLSLATARSRLTSYLLRG